jgi:tetratricopeptide (TPR) repeat protein
MNEAYKVLSNPQHRKTYDAQRQAEHAEEQHRQWERAEEERRRKERRKQEDAEAARHRAERVEATYQEKGRQPETAKKLFNQGLNKQNKKDYQAAIGDYTQAIAFDPQNATAYYNRGLSHKATKRLKMVRQHERIIGKPQTFLNNRERHLVIKILWTESKGA